MRLSSSPYGRYDREIRNEVDKAALAREGAIRSHRWWSEHRDFLGGAIDVLRTAGSGHDLFSWHQVLLQRYVEVQALGQEARARKQELRLALQDALLPVQLKREVSEAIGDAELDRRVANAIRSSLRDLGDAVAWHLVGYRRGSIAALGHGKRVDRLAVDGGLEAELQEIRRLWDSEQSFALHCDLTNSVRHADLLVVEGWSPLSLRLSEVKTSRPVGQQHRQTRRLQQLTDVLTGGGCPPDGVGPYPPRECPVELTTHHEHLRELIHAAERTTYAWREVEPGFALVVIDERDPGGLGPAGLEKARRDHLETQTWGELNAEGQFELSCSSPYRVLRDRRHSFPGQVPLSLLPLEPDVVSQIMCGPLLYWTSIDARRLTTRFSEHGIHADVATGGLAGDTFLTASDNNRHITMPAPAREMLLIELITIASLIDVARWLLDHPASQQWASDFNVDYRADAGIWSLSGA